MVERGDGALWREQGPGKESRVKSSIVSNASGQSVGVVYQQGSLLANKGQKTRPDPNSFCTPLPPRPLDRLVRFGYRRVSLVASYTTTAKLTTSTASAGVEKGVKKGPGLEI